MSNCKAAAANGFRVSQAIRGFFQYLDEVFRLLYPTFVRLYLEYEIQVASTCFKYEADMLERGTNLVRGLSDLSYENKLRHINLFPSSCRRMQSEGVRNQHNKHKQA